MKNLCRLAFVLVLLAPVAGCAYFDREEEDSAKDAGAKIDLTAAAPQDTVAGKTKSTSNLPDMIRTSTRNAVDYFPIDEDAVPVEDMTPVVKNKFNGTTYSMDPSVEIFPLDEEMARALPHRIEPAPLKPLRPEAYSVVPLDSGSESLPQVVTQSGSEAVIYFERGATQLDAAGDTTVSEIASSGRASGAVTVEGHASTESSIDDPVRRKIVNLKVSMDRALSVARALIENGVAAEHITTTAYGETRPAATAEQSRRVEIQGLKAP